MSLAFLAARLGVLLTFFALAGETSDRPQRRLYPHFSASPAPSSSSSFFASYSFTHPATLLYVSASPSFAFLAPLSFLSVQSRIPSVLVAVVLLLPFFLFSRSPSPLYCAETTQPLATLPAMRSKTVLRPASCLGFLERNELSMRREQ